MSSWSSITIRTTGTDVSEKVHVALIIRTENLLYWPSYGQGREVDGSTAPVKDDLLEIYGFAILSSYTADCWYELGENAIGTQTSCHCPLNEPM